jgi:hypothetical protein
MELACQCTVHHVAIGMLTELEERHSHICTMFAPFFFVI